MNTSFFVSPDHSGQVRSILSISKGHSSLLDVPEKSLVGLDGLEPSTSRLSGARSSHLSYRPLFALVIKVLVILVEMMGIEPMTPCLQGRCSPS